MSFFEDISDVFYLVKIIALVGVLLSTGELLYNFKEYKRNGIFSWKIISSRKELLNDSILLKVVSPFMVYPNFVVVLLSRLLVIIALMALSLDPWVESLCLGVIIISGFIINYRSPYGQDGADQMSTILFFVLFLYSFDKQNMLVAKAGIWFICLQTLLSYFTAGVAKAYGPKWTSKPVAVFQIFNTSTYGYKPVATILKDRHQLTAFLTWSTVAIECAFPISIFLGVGGTLAFLAWGAAFHFLNAVIMGLNAFLWAFLAAYPAVIYCAIQLQGILY